MPVPPMHIVAVSMAVSTVTAAEVQLLTGSSGVQDFVEEDKLRRAA